MKKLQALLFLILSISCALTAATISVCASGCDHTTIAAAVSAAASGDVIDIQYTGAAYTEDYILISKNLTIQGQGQSATIIQAAATQAAADDKVFQVSAGYTVTFENLTIQNGNANGLGSSSTQLGGGVNISVNASTNVSFNQVTITNCRAGSFGGGIYITGSGGSVSFTDCVISNNTANTTGEYSGGGIYNGGASNLTLTRCRITGNSAGRSGGGINISSSGATNNFTNCTIDNNTTGAGTSIGAQGAGVNNFTASTTSFFNCTITNNTLVGTAARLGGGIYHKSTSLELTNTIVANNSGASSSATGDDIYSFSGSITQTTSLVEDCDGSCPTFSYTSDPNLAAAATCGDLAYFAPQSPSEALNTGTAPGGNIPSTDICGNAVTSVKDIGSFETNIILPTELIDFQANAREEQILLTWKTSAEINNEGFEIEYSRDAYNWKYLDFISGQDISFETNHYSFLHQNPMPGINYYRLKQLDYNGTFQYSETLSLDLLHLGDLANLQVAPNPVQNGSFTLYLPENFSNMNGHDEGFQVPIQLYNSVGHLIYSENIYGNKTTVEVHELPKGLYFLMVKFFRKNIVKKIIVK